MKRDKKLREEGGVIHLQSVTGHAQAAGVTRKPVKKAESYLFSQSLAMLRHQA